MKWFTNVRTVEELRKQYRQLMKKHHPDVGGSNEDAKQINAEYERLFAILSRQEAQERKGTTEDKVAEDKAIRAVLDALAGIDTDVEIIGSWVWVTRNSFPYKELLKSLNFRYASKKKAWYFHADEYHRRSKREVTLEQIRAKYGSERVNNHRERKAVAG